MNITVTLNNNKEMNLAVDNYKASELVTKLNDQQLTMINIGDLVINKHSIMMISPTENAPTLVPVAE